MKQIALIFSVLLMWPAAAPPAAEPLAQKYVVVHQVRDLDNPGKAVCVGTPDIINLPSGRLIASMELWLKLPNSGKEGGIDYPIHCKIKASDDGGSTWKQISSNGITWGSLFYVKDALYMIGNDPHKRDIRIIRSPDVGKSWSDPVSLFADSRYHGSATPVYVKDGLDLHLDGSRSLSGPQTACRTWLLRQSGQHTQDSDAQLQHRRTQLVPGRLRIYEQEPAGVV